MALIKWTPMLDPFNEMDRFLDGFSGGLSSFAPAVDVWENENNVFVETPLPGIDPEKVNISIENDVLTIEGSAEKKNEVDEKIITEKRCAMGLFTEP